MALNNNLISKVISTSVLIKSLSSQENAVLEHSYIQLKQRFCDDLDSFVAEYT